MTRAAFVIPGDFGLPTGGYTYDRRVLALAAEAGLEMRHVGLPGSFPSPTHDDIERTRTILAALPADTVLLIDGLAYGAMPASLIASIRSPIVALCHHPLALEEGLTPARAAELKLSETVALAHARHVIATSPTTRATLIRDFAVRPERCTVAEPGTDPAPRATGSGSTTPALLAVGSVVPRKGYAVLIEALAGLAGRPWQLTIAGPDDRSPETTRAVKAAIAAAGLDARISMLGAVDTPALAKLYAATDIFVMPSLFEGYGMVLGEAMARGLPIVCTTGGAAAETAPDAAALKVAPGDAAAFREALARLLDDAGLRGRMAAASRAAGEALPRWSDTARIIAEALRKVTP